MNTASHTDNILCSIETRCDTVQADLELLISCFLPPPHPLPKVLQLQGCTLRQHLNKCYLVLWDNYLGLISPTYKMGK